MNLRQGTLLQGGKYRIERELGHGGFGVTYLAVQVGLNRRVAIKEFFMSEYCNRDAETSHVSVPSEGSKELVAKFRNKFVKEAQNIASLKHPHIISIHDVFEDNGTAYYVMEYLDHGSLADLVKQRGRLPEADALRYIRQIADALRYIHARKMSHLDVKPGNILVDEEDHAVLIDFGLSKRYDDEGNQTSTTPVGISHGYAPLEQYKKGGVGTFSPATDIYSLGATLYKLITGATPPDANDILTDGLPAHPDVMSLPVYEAIEQAMQPNKNHRPQSVEAFLALLDAPAAPAPEAAKEGDVPTEVIAEEPASLDDDNTSYPLRLEEESPMERDSADITAPSPRTKSSFSLKKLFWSLLACVVAVGIFFGVRACNDYRAEAARSAEIEQHRLDSIAQVEEDVEKAKQAQLEQQRKDSLSLVPSGESNGYGYVDLGLSVKWATCNVGASAPYEAGDRYAWGETSTKKEYTEKNSATYGKSMNGIAGSSSHDAAYAQWKGDWHIPTKEHCLELIDKCTWTWTTLQGVNGYRVTGPSGKSIFLPIVEGYGDYWSSTPNGEDPSYSYHLYFDGREHSLYPTGRRLAGLCIRPVTGELAKAKEEQSQPTKSTENYSKQDGKKQKTSSTPESEQKENTNKSTQTKEDAETQFLLGKRYYEGSGVKKDYVEAVRWFRKAAEQGHTRAQYMLGTCYFRGEGVTRDFTEAVKWYRKAAEKGNAEAQWGLGMCYEGGYGVTKDYAEAEKWYRKAARQGHDGAKFDLENLSAHIQRDNELEAAREAVDAAIEEAKKEEEKAKAEKAKQAQLTGVINGHEWVDLGLSVKWGTSNVGADAPSDYGNYYAWGETSTKSKYTRATYKHYRIGEYVDIGGNISGTRYDVARANWGGTWRMPTVEEIKELINKCTWTWKYDGYLVTGPNGKSIFLPAIGFDGCYWSATPFSDYSACCLGFSSVNYGCYYDNRYEDNWIRPVTE